MKILTLGLVLITLSISCKNEEDRRQKHEEKKRTTPYQEVMPEKGRR